MYFELFFVCGVFRAIVVAIGAVVMYLLSVSFASCIGVSSTLWTVTCIVLLMLVVSLLRGRVVGGEMPCCPSARSSRLISTVLQFCCIMLISLRVELWFLLLLLTGVGDLVLFII